MWPGTSQPGLEQDGRSVHCPEIFHEMGRSCIQVQRISTQSEIEKGGEWGDASDRRETVGGVDQRQRVDLDLSFIRVGPLETENEKGQRER